MHEDGSETRDTDEPVAPYIRCTAHGLVGVMNGPSIDQPDPGGKMPKQMARHAMDCMGAYLACPR